MLGIPSKDRRLNTDLGRFAIASKLVLYESYMLLVRATPSYLWDLQLPALKTPAKNALNVIL